MKKLKCFPHLPFLIILCVRVFCLNVRLYTEGGQRRVSGPPETELQIVVSYYLILGTKPESFARATSALDYEAVSPAPHLLFLIHLLRRRTPSLTFLLQ